MDQSVFLPKNYRKNVLIVLAGLAIYLALWVLLDLQHLLTLETLATHRNNLQGIVNKNYWYAVALYIGSLVVHSICALPATSLFFVAAGMLFGWYQGIFYAWIGSMIGGYALFSITTSHLGIRLYNHYRVSLEPLQQRIREHAFTALVIMRSIPIVPFFLINISAGLALVSRVTFISSLLIGSLPSICLYVFLGTELTQLSLFVAFLQNPFLVMSCVAIGGCLLFIVHTRWLAQQSHN